MMRTKQRFSALSSADKNVRATMKSFFLLCFLFTAIALPPASILAQTALPCDSTIKQVLFVVDVSGSMETNDRLAEVKQFALRTVRERSKEKLLFKLISYGGSCNDVQTDVDWTRDAAVINAGIKGLYLRGGTPLGSALEFTIDNVKKSAYPDQTLILLLNDGANGCGSVQDILSQRIREIPCVRINVLGIELQDDENNLAERALADAEAISKATSGRFIPLNDVRELQGVTIADTGVVMRSVAFAPRKKVAKDTSAKTPTQITPTQTTTAQATPENSNNTSSQTAAKKDTSQTLASNTRTEEKPQTTNTQTTSNQTTNNQAASSQSTQTKENRSTQPVRETSSETSSQTTRSPKQSQTQQSSTQQTEQPTSSKNKTSTKPSKQDVIKQPQRKQRVMQSSATKPQSERLEQQRSSAPPQGTSSQVSIYAPSKDSTQNTGWGATEEGIIVFYTPNSAVLLPQMKQGLERLVERLKQSGVPIQNIVVEGHSSIEGSSAANLRLSVERASSVAAFLQTQLRLPAGRITWNAFGEVRPVAANTTEAGRQENRRVEVRVIRSTQRAQ